MDYDFAGGVTYNADFDYAGSDSWTTIVSDNEGGSTQISFSVDVVNQLPVCQSVSIETPHDQQGFAEPNCTDPDGDGLTYGVNPAGHGTSSESFGSLGYDPAAGDRDRTASPTTPWTASVRARRRTSA